MKSKPQIPISEIFIECFQDSLKKKNLWFLLFKKNLHRLIFKFLKMILTITLHFHRR